MKLIIAVAFLPVLAGTCKESKTDSVAVATSANETKQADKDVADFLVKITDARLMDGAEGELATKNATIEKLRDYGRVMTVEQERLLEEIKKLAAQRNITLPTRISAEKQAGYDELAAKSGKAFDKKFIKMMRIDHERDIRDFKKAKELKDTAVARFAVDNLPVIEHHLDSILEISDGLKDKDEEEK